MLDLVDRPPFIGRVAPRRALRRRLERDATPIGAATPAACECWYAPPTRTGDSPVAPSRHAHVLEQYAVAEPAGLIDLFIG